MSDRALKTIPRSTLRGQLVSKVLNAIFSGELKGGDRLIEEELAMKLGVSRTPIREALGELAAIGVIRLKPNHGAMVRPFGPEQLVEIYHVRRVLEVEATRLAAQRIDPESLKDIRKRTMDLIQAEKGENFAEAALALDGEFHELISRSAGSERLAEEIGKYRNLVISVGNAVGNKLHAHDQNIQEHLKVIEQMLEKHGEEAAAAMGHHIDRGADTAAKAMGLMYAR
jgi:DNA-binding GntR family transcriptional regulator